MDQESIVHPTRAFCSHQPPNLLRFVGSNDEARAQSDDSTPTLIPCPLNSTPTYMRRFGGRGLFPSLFPLRNCVCIELRTTNRGGKLTLKTLGTVTVSLVASPLAEMTVTVGLDIVAIVGVAAVLVDEEEQSDFARSSKFEIRADGGGASPVLVSGLAQHRYTA